MDPSALHEIFCFGWAETLALVYPACNGSMLASLTLMEIRDWGLIALPWSLPLFISQATQLRKCPLCHHSKSHCKLENSVFYARATPSFIHCIRNKPRRLPF
ncbi:hypothetical protein RSK60_1640005 [Ralstonia solanacearum K60]|nr:hypothetical protein RSK60_1640005 [Ralstonia solanacearum K60]